LPNEVLSERRPRRDESFRGKSHRRENEPPTSFFDRNIGARLWGRRPRRDDVAMNPKRPVILCDFDGTITNRDVIISIMAHFAPPQWEAIKDEILARRLSIRAGVERLFALIPFHRKAEIAAWAVANMTIRQGFVQFLTEVRRRDIEFRVVSGGMGFFVRPILAPFAIAPSEILVSDVVERSDGMMGVAWATPCDDQCNNDCGLCKPTVLRGLVGRHRVVIGDSVTDLAGARIAETVFARDYLARTLGEEGRTFYPFETFDDITPKLADLV